MTALRGLDHPPPFHGIPLDGLPSSLPPSGVDAALHPRRERRFGFNYDPNPFITLFLAYERRSMLRSHFRAIRSPLPLQRQHRALQLRRPTETALFCSLLCPAFEIRKNFLLVRTMESHRVISARNSSQCAMYNILEVCLACIHLRECIQCCLRLSIVCG